MAIRVVSSQKGLPQKWFEELGENTSNPNITELLSIAERGAGVPPENFRQNFQVQKGLSCQTMAIIEGLHAVSPTNTTILPNNERLHDIVRNMRQRLSQQTSVDLSNPAQENPSLLVETIFQKLTENTNLPISRELVQDDPPALVHRLFEGGSKKRYIVAVDIPTNAQGIGHAYAIVPVTQPTRNHFAKKIDTLYGQCNPSDPTCVLPEDMTLEQFVDKLRGHFDNSSPRFQLHLITLDEEKMPKIRVLKNIPASPGNMPPSNKVIRIVHKK